jgi:hypothetical protein
MYARSGLRSSVNITARPSQAAALDPAIGGLPGVKAAPTRYRKHWIAASRRGDASAEISTDKSSRDFQTPAAIVGPINLPIAGIAVLAATPSAARQNEPRSEPASHKAVNRSSIAGRRKRELLRSGANAPSTPPESSTRRSRQMA